MLKKTDPAPLPDGFLERLGALVGDRLQLGEAVRLQHGSSETHFAAAPPDAVVFPASTEEVVEIVRLCGEMEVPIIAFGAGTSLEGNVTPVRGGISLDMSEMNAILAVNAEDFDCTVQAGVRREQLNEHLRDMGLFFPIDPGANATIGGMASTRASGTNAVRYGTMREAILSLRVVTPDGRDIRTARRARKSAAGYDLTRLMIGSEGTLGIITEVTLRLHGIPETISSAVCSFETLEGAVDTVVQSIQLGVPLARVEILDDVQMKAVNAWSKLDYPELTTLFFEFHGSPAGVAEQVETVKAPRRGQWRRRVPLVEPARGALEAVEGAARGLLRRGQRAPRRDRLGDRRLRADRPARRLHRRDQAGPRQSRPCRRRSSAMSATAISTSSSRSTPTAPEEMEEVEATQRPPGPARAGDGRHLHRRARHRPRQAAMADRRARRRAVEMHANDQARARPEEPVQPGQDLSDLGSGDWGTAASPSPFGERERPARRSRLGG